MKASLFLTLFFSFVLVACTGRSSRNEETQTTEAVENTDTANADEIIADDAAAVEEAVLAGQTAQDPVLAADEIAATAEQPIIDNSTSDYPSNQIEKKVYKVKKDETLMLIAFKIYGDYSKWKELRDLNRKKLINGLLVKNGAEIEYMSDGTEFVWQPKGNPHLIKSGDTLSLISKAYYGTLKKWKDLWENNKPMVKDPNKIYAGFTLYYQPESKNVAQN